MTLELPGAKTTIDGRSEARKAVRVLDVDAAGVMLTELVLEDQKITVDGKSEDRVDDPWTFRVQPDGRVVEKIQGAEDTEDFPFALPGRPVRIGESWTKRSTTTTAGFTGQATGTYTIEAIDRIGEARVARIRFGSRAPWVARAT